VQPPAAPSGGSGSSSKAGKKGIAAKQGAQGDAKWVYSEPPPHWPLSRRPLISTMQASTAASHVAHLNNHFLF
jgi:hypothetical protein